MADGSASKPERRPTLTKRAVVTWGVLVAVLGIGSAVVLFVLYPPPDSRSAVGIIRAAGTIALGTGGAAGLLLAARRQQKVEEANEDTREANENVRFDAEERRAIELQAQANEQLGHEKAAVRLGALTLLKRLANNHQKHQQDVADILCSYLRMPFTHPDKIPPAESGDIPTDNEIRADAEEKINQAREELQVRLTAQRVLAQHLRPETDKNTGEPTNEKFWNNNISLDLTGAVLVNFSFDGCLVGYCTMLDCHFEGPAWFKNAHFEDSASFKNAHFDDSAWFENAHFEDSASFKNAHFEGQAWFKDAHFERLAWFENAIFKDSALFDLAHFKGPARFENARFKGPASFSNNAHFEGPAQFNNVRFYGLALFGYTRFGRSAWFNYARFEDLAWFENARFEGPALFADVSFENQPQFDNVRCRWDVDRSGDTWPDGWTARGPEADDDGHFEGREGVWGYVVRVEDEQREDRDGDVVGGASVQP